MKKIILMTLLALLLTGCKTVAEIKPDTIVDIPLHPTQQETTAVTEPETVPAETEPQTEPETQEPTEKPTEKPSGGKTDSGGRNSGKGNISSKPPSQPLATQPPTESPTEAPTQPPTEPPTQPPTEPPTQPPTEPPTEAPTQPPSYDPSGYAPTGRDRAVAEAVNARRQAAGLPALTFDTRLCAIASVRAWEVSRVWNHQRPDGSGGLTVLAEYGYGYAWAAQSLYNGPRSGEQIVEKWMGSDSDSANILSENARTIGVGSYTASDGRIYTAVIFAG